MDYSIIFSKYYTIEGQEFNLLNRSVHFPDDETLKIYDKMYIASNVPWTVLSWQLYNTIEHWWVLSALNKSQFFYAAEGSEILFIKPEYIDSIINKIETNI